MKISFDNNNNIQQNKSNIHPSISDRHIHQMEYNIHTIKKRVPSLFIDKNKKNYYFSSTGITNLTLTTYNEFINDQAILFFNILSRYHVNDIFDYAVFAGNSVGLLRNKQVLPWGDDFDIIIFDKHVPILFKTICPELKNFGFKIETKINPNGVLCGIKVFGPTIKFDNSNSSSTSVFQCDVFFSYFDKNNILKNIGGWGLYHQKNIPYNVVLPFRQQMFYGMLLPFFNNPKKEVELSYTNIDKCSIFSHHLHKSEKNLTGTIFYNKWENAYLDFNYILKKSIENTKNIISNAIYSNLSGNSPFNKNELVLNADNKNELVLNAANKNLLGRSSCILSKLNFFCYLSQHNVGSIIAHACASEFICEHAIDVKFYFPEINITYIDDGCKPSPVPPIFYIYIDIFIKGEEKK